MICKKLSVVALSGLTAVLSLSAMAQDTTTTTTSTTDTATTAAPASTPMMSMEPMTASGTVLRYYTSRAGYVSAADIQTADGVRMVRFSPSMGQRIYSTYPVGGQFLGTLQPSMSMGSARYDVVALGDSMPAAGMMKPDMTSDIELLRAEPFITAGSGLIQFHGKLSSVVTDDNGEVLGLVLKGAKTPATKSAAMAATDTAAMSTDATATGMAMDPMAAAQDSVLVRVPRELRHHSGEQVAGSERVASLLPGSDVEVVGYQEAPRYGVVSAYGDRIYASALIINGRSVGALGIPLVMNDRKGTLLGNLFGGKKAKSSGTPEEATAMKAGYMTYGMSPSSSDMSGSAGMSSDTSMTTSTTTTGGM